MPTKIYNNETAGQAIVARFGGYIRREGSSVIHHDSDTGFDSLVRFTSEHSVTISCPIYCGGLHDVWFCFADRSAGYIPFSSQLKSVSHRHTQYVL